MQVMKRYNTNMAAHSYALDQNRNERQKLCLLIELRSLLRGRSAQLVAELTHMEQSQELEQLLSLRPLRDGSVKNCSTRVDQG